MQKDRVSVTTLLLRPFDFGTRRLIEALPGLVRGEITLYVQTTTATDRS